MIVIAIVGTVLMAISIYKLLEWKYSDDIIKVEQPLIDIITKKIDKDCIYILDYYIPDISTSYDKVLVSKCIDVIDENNTAYEKHEKILMLKDSLTHFEYQMFEPNQWAELINDVKIYYEAINNYPSILPQKFTLKELNDMVTQECVSVLNINMDHDIEQVCKLIIASQTDCVKRICIYKLNYLLSCKKIQDDNLLNLRKRVQLYMNNMPVCYYSSMNNQNTV